MAFVSYILITQPSSAWLHPIAVAFALIACIEVRGEIVWRWVQRDHKIIAASRGISGMISQLASAEPGPDLRRWWTGLTNADGTLTSADSSVGRPGAIRAAAADHPLQRDIWWPPGQRLCPTDLGKAVPGVDRRSQRPYAQ
jgi:hypothetical protein